MYEDKDIERWITWRGRHIPISKDGKIINKNIDFMDKKLDKSREGLREDDISDKIKIGKIKSKKGNEYELSSQEINLSSPYVGKRYIRKITATDKNGNEAILSFYKENNDIIIKHIEGAKKGDGSGTMLLNKLIKESKKNNIKKIIADDTRSLNAEKYWEKQGFVSDNKNNHILKLK